jgi:type II secretory pathway pseudopilin PulG
MRIRCGKRTAGGTTLTEVVMATFVLGIAASGIMGSFTYGFYVLQNVRENQRATQIILEKVETIRLYNWDEVNTSGFVPATFTDVFDPQADANSRGITYFGSVTITNLPFTNSYSGNMRRLVVNLKWDNGHTTRNRSLTTYIAKDGLQNYVY